MFSMTTITGKRTTRERKEAVASEDSSGVPKRHRASEDDDDTTVTNVTNVTNVTALASLPCEAQITVTNGVNYYQCGANWYTRAYQGDAVVYVPSGPPPSG